MGFLPHRKAFYLKRSKDISKQQEKWKIEKENIKKENAIKQQYEELTEEKRRITTSKLVLLIFLILVVAIFIFIGWATIAEFSIAAAVGQMPGFAPLTALAGTVLSTALVILGYFFKSAKENTQGGITYEKAAANNFDLGEPDQPEESMSGAATNQEGEQK